MEISNHKVDLQKVNAQILASSPFSLETIELYRSEYLANTIAAGFKYSPIEFHYGLALRILSYGAPVSLFAANKYLLNLVTDLPCNREYRKPLKSLLKAFDQVLAGHKSGVRDITINMTEMDTYYISLILEESERGIEEMGIQFKTTSFQEVLQLIPYAISESLPAFIMEVQG